MQHHVDGVAHVEVQARDAVAARVLAGAAQREIALGPEVGGVDGAGQLRGEVEGRARGARGGGDGRVGARELLQRQQVEEILRPRMWL